MPVTRFAPSPTGLLHLGHAYSALFAERAAEGGRFLLRIEDIDTARCRPEFETAIFDDLAWLGLAWEEPVRRQSDHFADYEAALSRLKEIGVVYPCFCTRKEIQAEIARMTGAPQGPDGPLYPGTCRRLDREEAARRIAAGEPHAIRLNVAAALSRTGPLDWHDQARGRQRATPEALGDVVLSRKDAPSSYHLAVTVDDHLQGVTLVTRGLDLFPSTHVHRLLQALLGYAPPDYHHHGLVTDERGERLAKRADSRAIRAYREQGLSPAEVRRVAGWLE
ncbi:MAG TPA: tRNA glutamyl-Q(34) synthetase GluQRS [Alphaproteobacteria bacterium]|nr:tRNA glutamyl-Q(34) synthetase GluQRS [Alphaproteobacteria bacterium]